MADKIYKARFTIRTDEYSNIRPFVEGTAEEIVESYREFEKLIKPQDGITEKEMNAITDKYLGGEPMTPDDQELYHRMNPEQRGHIQWVKRAFARIKARQQKV